MRNIFTGKTYLTFDRDPEWCSYDDYYLKTVLNLWFIKLVLRIKATGYKDEVLYKARKIFATVSTECQGNINQPSCVSFLSNAAHPDKVFNKMYCYNASGANCGSLYEMAWVLDHDCTADPVDVGIFSMNAYTGCLVDARLGFAIFKIGDRLFDHEWKPSKFDPDYKPYYAEISKHLQAENYEQAAVLVKKYLKTKPLSERGNKIIKSFPQCKEAAMNFQKFHAEID